MHKSIVQFRECGAINRDNSVRFTYTDGSIHQQCRSVMNSAFQMVPSADPATLIQQMEKQANLLRGILQSVQCGILLTKPIYDATGLVADFQVTITNQRITEMTGFTQEQIRTQSMLTLDPTGKTNGIFDHYIAALSNTETVEVEHYFEPTDRWLRQTLTPFEGSVLVSMIDITTQKKAQIAQKQQAELLQTVIDNVQVGLGLMEAVRNEAGKIIDFRLQLTNEANARVTQLPVEVMMHQLMTHLLPGTVETGFLDTLIHVTETGKAVAFEFPYEHGNVSGWFDVRIARQGDGILFSSLDITKRKRSEQAAEQQTELLRSVLDGSQNGIIAFDAVRNEHGNIVDFRYALQNETNRQRVGRTDEQLLGHTMAEFFPETAQNGLIAQYSYVVTSGESLRFESEFTYKNKSGWFAYSIVKRGDGIVMNVQDKTAEKNAELAVQRQALFLQTVINTSPAGIIVYKAVRNQEQQITDFVVELANVGGAQLVGRQTPPDFIGRLMSELLPSHEGRDFFEQVAQVVETGNSNAWLLPYFSDGIEGWFNMSLVKQDDQAVVTFLDVTDLKALQQQLENQNIDLRRSNDNLQQFAYVASHDLQEPLRKINTFSQILLNEHALNLTDSGQDMLRRVQTAANRMSMLIKDLLAYSRLSTQHDPFKPVPLSTLVGRVIDDLEIAISEADATITVDDLPTIIGDEFQLTQLVQNLVSNAVKFRRTPKPGETYMPLVRIGSRRVTLSEVPESLRQQNTPVNHRTPEKGPTFYEINISDNGIGFDEKYADRIFQVFQRLHGKNQFPGSGVGLAICRKVVDNHKGAISVESQLGQGTTFRVFLPVR